MYSNTNFNIETESEDLKARSYFGTVANLRVPFDNLLMVQPTNTQSTCQIGVGFKEGHVGLISQVKYFMGDINTPSLYVDLLKFQGSNDNTTWTDLYTADDNIHEGWNYVDWNETG